MIHSRVSWMFLPGGEIHHRVGAPQRGPAELLDLFLDRGSDRRVADVGVDLDVEVAADDHRLQLGVVDVGRDDGPAPGDLAAHELGGHAFPQSDELHLFGDLALTGVVELGDGAAAA